MYIYSQKAIFTIVFSDFEAAFGKIYPPVVKIIGYC